MLDNNKSPAEISGVLNRPRKTITNEIQNHRKHIKADGNDCLEYIFKTCKVRTACKYKCNDKLCKNCKYTECNNVCSDYVKAFCERLERSPHVCNGCDKFYRCHYDKYIYKAIKANETANAVLHDKRSGFNLTEAELKKIDDIVSPLIKNGQTPYAVCQALGDKLSISEATLYRMIDARILSCRNIDLPERVKRKSCLKKRRNKDAYAVLTTAKLGHMWSDYLKYTEEHDVMTVQMDCVIGKREDTTALLTLHWEVPHFQIAVLLETHTAKGVIKAFDTIEETLGLILFRQMFPIILTDNGEEFTDIEGMQRSCTVDGELRTYIYFCEPNRSDEKGECERNHREMRKIIPKGTSLDPYMQSDISLVINHLNSYVRKSLGGKCPFDLAKAIFPEDFFVLLGLEQVKSQDVIMKPELLTHNHKVKTS